VSVARSLKADPASVADYDWSGRTIERHRGEIRRHFGFRVCGEDEGAKLALFQGARLLAGRITGRLAGQSIARAAGRHR
jgi:hypothetical protein